MRYWVTGLAVAFLLAGCLDNGDTTVQGDDPAGPMDNRTDGSMDVQEVYSGDLVTLQAGGLFAYSHDQLGDNHREFWVVNDTKEVRLELQTTVSDLRMRAVGPDCSQEPLQKHGFMAPPDCALEASTEAGSGNLTIEDPDEGPWMVYFFMAERDVAEAEDVPYRLSVTKIQPAHKSLQEERYPGDVVVAHLGATRISPDQLGDVYREFWVHEGTKRLELEFEASEDVYLAYGQNFRSRDRLTEQGVDTEDGKANLTFSGDDLVHGGWYFIVFHESTDLPVPNVSEVSYEMTVTKHRSDQAILVESVASS